MSKRRSTVSALIQQLNPDIIKRILNYKIPPREMQKLEEEETKEIVNKLEDLRELPNHSESEVYQALNKITELKQYFIHCGPILVNINPGQSTASEDYLNMRKWLNLNDSNAENKFKPHLYSFMNYIYNNMCLEGNNQVINLLGEVGSGKTYNLFHIIEYFTYTCSPDKQGSEIFEVIHKSIQLIHIMGSVFRQGNLESTCCSLLLKLGFGEEGLINNFDFESTILDITLPFSENGRSFSILHSLIACANYEIKKNIDLTESETSLNFFQKYVKRFDNKTKEVFKLNDMELWSRFHSLLQFFKFERPEVYEILRLLTLILHCNDAQIAKKKVSFNKDEYFINKGANLKKLVKNLAIPNEQDFLDKFGTYESLEEIKGALVKMMKLSYNCVFEFVKFKIKSYINGFFELKYSQNKIKKPSKKSRTLHLIDMPGEVDDQTLGGLMTNLANECQNVMASAHYLSVVEKLEDDQLNVKNFKKLHCTEVLDNILGNQGLFKFLSKKFPEYFFEIPRNEKMKKTFEFSEHEIEGDLKSRDYAFKINFSQKQVIYNYQALHNEAQTLVLSKKLINLFGLSRNAIVAFCFENFPALFEEKESFFKYAQEKLSSIFSSLQGMNPYIIYSLHSKNSMKMFYKDTFKEKGNFNTYGFNSIWYIPIKNTIEACKNSLIIPVLFWEWYGYHEWMEVSSFISEFADDFEKVKGLLKLGNKKKGGDVPFKNLLPHEVVTYMLSILIGKKQYILGAKYCIFRVGTLKDIRRIITNLKIVAENSKVNQSARSSASSLSNKKSFVRQGSANSSQKRLETKLDTKRVDTKRVETKFDNKKLETKHHDAGGKRVETKMETNFSNASKSDLVRVSNLKHNGGHHRSASAGGSPKKVSIVKRERGSVYSQAGEGAGTNTRRSMKIQAHYNIVESVDKDDNTYKNIEIQPPKRLNLVRYLSEEIMSEVVKPNEEEVTNYQKYLEKNNVFVADSMKTFNAVKSLLFDDKPENYQLFDHKEVLPEIIKIQACFRAFKYKNKYKVYRYLVRKFIQVQTKFRSWIARKKFLRFRWVLAKTIMIQRVFTARFRKRKWAACAIQHKFRGSVGYRAWIIDRKKSQILMEQLELAKAGRKGGKFLSEDDYDKISDLERQLDMFKSKDDHGGHNHPNQRISRLMMNRESKNQNVVIDHDQEEKNEVINQLLNTKNQNYTRNSIPTYFNNMTLTNDHGFSYQKSKAVLKTNIEPGSKRVEDRLIEHGKNLKQKREKKLVDKLLEEKQKYDFKPQMSTSSNKAFDISKFGQSFYERAAYMNCVQREKLDHLKTKLRLKKDEDEYTFHPKIDEKLKGYKRSFHDLLDWNCKNEQKKNLMKLEKEQQDEQVLELNRKKNMMNSKSKQIIKQKISRNRSMDDITIDRYEDMCDLWPEKPKKY